MFLRRCKRRKNGKQHTYWALSKTIRLRCVTTPDEAQKLLLNRLGLTLPQRLRRIDEVIQM